VWKGLREVALLFSCGGIHPGRENVEIKGWHRPLAKKNQTNATPQSLDQRGRTAIRMHFFYRAWSRGSLLTNLVCVAILGSFSPPP